MMMWTKIDTTMADKLQQDFDFSPELCALAYAIQFVGFLSISPFCHKIMQKVDNTLLISISQIVQGVASFLIGPSQIMDSFLPNSLGVIFSGLFLTGLANTFTTISTYKEMHDPFIERFGVTSAHHNEKLSDILSGLYNAGFSTGVILGPLIASYITLGLNSYRLQSDCFAFFGIGFGVLHFLVVFVPRYLRRNSTMKFAVTEP